VSTATTAVRSLRLMNFSSPVDAPADVPALRRRRYESVWRRWVTARFARGVDPVREAAACYHLAARS
jgi:hypothetical protein